MGKGDERRPGVGYAEHWGRIFESELAKDAKAPMECPSCKEITLEHKQDAWWECANCGQEVGI